MESKIVVSIFVASVILALTISVMEEVYSIPLGQSKRDEFDRALLASCPEHQIKIIGKFDSFNNKIEPNLFCAKKCKQFAEDDYYQWNRDRTRWDPIVGTVEYTKYEWKCCCRGVDAFNAAKAKVMKGLK